MNQLISFADDFQAQRLKMYKMALESVVSQGLDDNLNGREIDGKRQKEKGCR